MARQFFKDAKDTKFFTSRNQKDGKRCAMLLDKFAHLVSEKSIGLVLAELLVVWFQVLANDLFARIHGQWRQGKDQFSPFLFNGLVSWDELSLS